MTWDTVIGLEVHAQLKTESKLFSGASTQFGAAANTHTSYIDAALPGVLPVLNQKAVELAVLFGLATQAQINDESTFERKNYFYPDLPKGYQISQFERPIVSQGYLDIETDSGQLKRVDIVRAHLEEDAGKSLHEAHSDLTGIDLNRAGTPLLEIVTSPCLDSTAEVLAYLRTLHQLLRFLDICDGNMQEGSFRCDVNLSVKPAGSPVLGTRVELKNINSFKFIEKAIEYERDRQIELIEEGGKVIQETRLFCPDREITLPMRAKENENDYRYFPDPDLLPIKLTEAIYNKAKAGLANLPQSLLAGLTANPELNQEDRMFLMSSPGIYHYFNKLQQQTRASQKLIVNWMKGPIMAALNEFGLEFHQVPVAIPQLALLLDRQADQTLSHQQARQVFNLLWRGESNVDAIIEREGFNQKQDQSELEELIKQLILDNPQQAADYRAGKEKLLAYFVGLVMKQSKSKGDPELTSRLFREFLQKT